MLKFKKGGTPKYKGSGTKDACYHKAVEIYGAKTSAYRSGYMSKCRKNKKEGGVILQNGGKIPDYVSKYIAEPSSLSSVQTKFAQNWLKLNPESAKTLFMDRGVDIVGEKEAPQQADVTAQEKDPLRFRNSIYQDKTQLQQAVAKGQAIESTDSPLDVIGGGAVKAGAKLLGKTLLSETTKRGVKKLPNVIKNAKDLTKPVYVYAETPVLKNLPKNLVNKAEPVSGAYKFQRPTTYDTGEFFNVGDVVEESSIRLKLNPLEYITNKSLIKTAKDKAGQDALLKVTDNPLFGYKNSNVIKENISPVDMVNKYGTTGASQVGKESLTFKNLSPNTKTIKRLFQDPAPNTTHASLIYDKGGIVFQKGGDIQMVNGVADILKKVKDKKNRKEIAKSMMLQFKKENVTFNRESFLKRADSLQKGGLIYGKNITADKADELLKMPKGWSQRNPIEAKKRLESARENGDFITEITLPEVEVEGKFIPGTESNPSPYARGFSKNPGIRTADGPLSLGSARETQVNQGVLKKVLKETAKLTPAGFPIGLAEAQNSTDVALAFTDLLPGKKVIKSLQKVGNKIIPVVGKTINSFSDEIVSTANSTGSMIKDKITKPVRQKLYERLNPYSYDYPVDRAKHVLFNNNSEIAGKIEKDQLRNPERTAVWGKYLRLDKPSDAIAKNKEDSYRFTNSHKLKLLAQTDGQEAFKVLSKQNDPDYLNSDYYKDYILPNLYTDKDGVKRYINRDIAFNTMGGYNTKLAADEKGKYLQFEDEWDIHPLQGYSSNNNFFASLPLINRLSKRTQEKINNKLKNVELGAVIGAKPLKLKQAWYVDEQGRPLLDDLGTIIQKPLSLLTATVGTGLGAKTVLENKEKKQGGVIFKKGGSIFDKEQKEGLRGWFGRNKNNGWRDCISKGPCGGDKAGKKRLCRPTLADCPDKSKLKKIASKKKMGENVSWK